VKGVENATGTEDLESVVVKARCTALKEIYKRLSLSTLTGREGTSDGDMLAHVECFFIPREQTSTIPNQMGKRCCFFCMLFVHVDSVAWLRDQGVDINITDIEGQTPMDYFCPVDSTGITIVCLLHDHE